MAAYLVRLTFSFYFSIKFSLFFVYTCVCCFGIVLYYGKLSEGPYKCTFQYNYAISRQFRFGKGRYPCTHWFPSMMKFISLQVAFPTREERKYKYHAIFTLKSSRTLVSIWESVIVENSIFPFYSGNVFGWMNIIIISLLQIIFVFTILTIIRFLCSSWFACWKVWPKLKPHPLAPSN